MGIALVLLLLSYLKSINTNTIPAFGISIQNNKYCSSVLCTICYIVIDEGSKLVYFVKSSQNKAKTSVAQFKLFLKCLPSYSQVLSSSKSKKKPPIVMNMTRLAKVTHTAGTPSIKIVNTNNSNSDGNVWNYSLQITNN